MQTSIETAYSYGERSVTNHTSLRRSLPRQNVLLSFLHALYI